MPTPAQMWEYQSLLLESTVQTRGWCLEQRWFRTAAEHERDKSTEVVIFHKSLDSPPHIPS